MGSKHEVTGTVPRYRRRLLHVSAAAVAAMLLASCADPASPEGEGEHPALLRAALLTVPTSLDTDSPEISDIYTNGAIGVNWTSPLFQDDVESASKGEPVPDTPGVAYGLATSVSVVDGGYEVQLRSDVKSAAGNELTSEDVKWTFDRLLANGGLGTLFLAVANVDTNKPITVTGPLTVQINTSDPSPLLAPLLVLPTFGIVDSVAAKAHSTEKDPWANEWMKTHSASFGPFEVSSFDPGKEIELTANENYWEGSPDAQKVILANAPNAASRAQLLQSGSVDFAEVIPPEQYDQLKESEKFQVQSMDSPQGLELAFNTATGAFTNASLRRAVAFGLDRSAIADVVYPGVATSLDQACSVSSIPVPDFQTEFTPAGDTSKASSLIGEAGEAPSDPLLLIYNTASNATNDAAARVIASQLNALGLDVQLKAYGSIADYTTAMTEGKWDMSLGLATVFANSPLYELKLFLASEEPSLNISHYSNPEFVSIVDRAAKSTSAESWPLVAQACDLAINQDVPIALLASAPYVVGATKELDALPVFPSARMNFAYMPWK